MTGVTIYNGSEDLYNPKQQGFNFKHHHQQDSIGSKQSNLPIHLQLVERSEYMKRLEINESSSSLGSLTPSSSSSRDSDGVSPISPNWGKHRYSTYYERSPFFRNPFSANNKKAQKLSYITSCISPESNKFILLHDDKWLVYALENDEPSLLCCGKINGDHGKDFDNLFKDSSISSKSRSVHYKSCALSERLLVLTLTDGSLRVHDMLENGKLFYHYNVGLQIESVDISPKNELIACGLQGRNKQTRGSIMLLISFQYKQHKIGDGITPELLNQLNNLNLEYSKEQQSDYFQPPQRTFLRKIGSKPSLRNLKKAAEKDSINTPIKVSAPVLELKLESNDAKLITLPYHGIVDNVKFSSKGDRLIFSTFKTESKFVVFDVTNPSNIKLVMKSSRTPDATGKNEGITDFELFGSNDKYMLITSNSEKSPPMLLNTKIETIEDITKSKPVQPKRVLKLDGLGTNVHKCCINSTNDLASFLTTDGKIWLAHLGKDELDNYKLKKLEVIDKVSGSNCYKNTACMRFSKDGTKMYIVDLKGVMFVQDFTSILRR